MICSNLDLSNPISFFDINVVFHLLAQVIQIKLVFLLWPKYYMGAVF